MILAKLRVGRSTNGLPALLRFYCAGSGPAKLIDFTAPHGFDGVMPGQPRAPYHPEFAHQPGYTAGRAPTADNLRVCCLPDAAEWQVPVPAGTSCRDQPGHTFADPAGCRVVQQQDEWSL